MDVLVVGPPRSSSAQCDTLVEALRAAGPRILVIDSRHDDRLTPCPLLASAEAVFDRARPFDELARDLRRAILRGSERARGRGIGHGSRGIRRTRDHSGLEALSFRERQVLGCLIDGTTVDEIADRSGLAIATVRSHVHMVLNKLGVNSQLAAVAIAHRAGWQARTYGNEG